jgi:hypothetical protein
VILHNKRAIQPTRIENGTDDLRHSLRSNMGLPLRNFILAAAVPTKSSLDINFLPSFTRHCEKPS